MPRRDDYEHWSMGLPAESEALADIDALVEELGLQRGEVCRLLIITWSKARRGKVQELWGFTPGVVFASGTGSGPGSTSEHQNVQATPEKKRKKVVDETTAAAVQGITLDLD